VQTLTARAALVRELRRFFGERDYLEIEPPTLLPTTGLEIHISSLVSSVSAATLQSKGERQKAYLHTSPELAMKKLVASGYDRIFAVCKVFRDGEVSERHNVEFTMLEWYRAHAHAEELMQETEALVRTLANTVAGAPRVLQQPFRRVSFREAFMALGINFDAIAEGDVQAFARAAERAGVRTANDDAFDDVFHRVCLEKIDPTLTGAVFVHDYPVELAVLARRNPARPRYAERFELFVDGLELCNGFGELTDATEQRSRFVAEQQERARRGLPVYPLDEPFLTALSTMPTCAGNALGVDRLVMLLLNERTIDAVLPFSTRRLF
jgi:lysyl-tRNA synthetase class 2